jgi:ABC-type transport system involved in multi-copper enzyme maturation permease subunit
MTIRPLFLQERWHAARIVGGRASRSSLLSLGLYVTVTLSLFFSSLLVRNNLEFANENSLVVMIRPLYLPVFVSTVLLSLYLALIATLGVARERDRGTLMVLFFGPMDEWSYLFGRLLGQTALFGFVLLANLAWALALASLTNLVFHWDILLVLLVALLVNGAVVSFGLFMAAYGRSSRASLVLFVVVTLVALAIQFGDQAILQFAAQAQPNRRDPILFLRQLLATMNQIIQWLSPYVQFSQAMDALVVGNMLRVVGHSIMIALQGTVLFMAAVWTLKRSGVQ